jgi:hypothetical protein
MYPTVIFVLVGAHRSFRDQVFTDAVLDGARSDVGSSVESSTYDIVELTIPAVDTGSIFDGTGSLAASVYGKNTGACERPVVLPV